MIDNNYCTNLLLQVQQYLLKIRLSQSSSSSCIIGKPQYKWYVYTILLIAHFLYFSAHYFRSRPVFRFSHRRLVHRQSHKYQNLAFYHQMALRTPFLCNFQQFSVSINSFYGNKDCKTCPEFQIIRDKIIYVQNHLRAGRKNCNFDQARVD